MLKITGLSKPPAFLFITFFLFFIFSNSLQAAAPSFTAVFSPATVAPGSETTLIFTIYTGSDEDAITILDGGFTNTLPSNLNFAELVNANSNCTGGSISAESGGTVLSVSNINLPQNSVCNVSVKVKTDITLAGATYTNTSDAFTPDSGSLGTAEASLVVNDTRPRYALSFSPDEITPGTVSRLTFEFISHLPATGSKNWFGVINLSDGLSVAATPDVVSDCPGTTITANPGGSAIDLRGSYFLENPGSCQVSVDVYPSSLGVLVASMSSLTFNSVNLGQSSAKLEVLTVFANFEFDPLVVAPGSTTSLLVTMTNRDRISALTDIIFSDNLDAVLSGLVATGLPLNDICGAGSLLTGDSIVSFSGGSLAPEASCEFSIPVSLPIDAEAGIYINTSSGISMLRNSVEVIGDQANNPVSNELRVSAAPVLEMNISDDEIASGASTVINYTVTNSNSESPVSGITFQHNLGVTFSGVSIPALPAADFCGIGSSAALSVVLDELILNVTGGNLAVGASCNFSVTIDLPDSTPGGDYTTSTGSISGIVSSVNLFGPGASDTITVVEGPSLKLELPTTATKPGEQALATFTLSKESLAPSMSGIGFSLNLEEMLTGLRVDPASLLGGCGPGSTLTTDTNLEIITLNAGVLDITDSCVFDALLTVPATAQSGSYALTISDLKSVVSGVVVDGPIVSADLEVSNVTATMSFIDGPYAPGDIATLRFSMVNNSATDNLSEMTFALDLNSVIPGLVASSLPSTPCGAGSSLAVSGSSLFLIDGNLVASAECEFDVAITIPLIADANTYNVVTSNLTFTQNVPAIVSPLATTLTVEIDEAPGVVVTSELSPATSVTAIPLTITFNENVVGFDIDDISGSVTNGTLENFSTVVSGRVYSVDIRPIIDGSVTLQVPADSAQDFASIPNGNTASEVFSIEFSADDFVLPTVIIGSPSQTSTSTGPVMYLISYFNADQVDLDAEEVILVSTDTAMANITVSNGATDTPTVALSSITGNGTLAIRLLANTARNSFGSVAASDISIPFEVINIQTTDDDLDGVSNEFDDCPMTEFDVPVDDVGCSSQQRLEIYCPVDGDYKNHGKYVRCVAHEVRNQVILGLISKKEGGKIISEAAKSDVGKPRHEEDKDEQDKYEQDKYEQDKYEQDKYEDKDNDSAAIDWCPLTATDVEVDEHGCSSQQRLELYCSVENEGKSHDKFVNCISFEVEEQKKMGIITEEEAEKILSDSAKNDTSELSVSTENDSAGSLGLFSLLILLSLLTIRKFYISRNMIDS